MYGKFYNVIIVSYVRPEGNSPVEPAVHALGGLFLWTIRCHKDE